MNKPMLDKKAAAVGLGFLAVVVPIGMWLFGLPLWQAAIAALGAMILLAVLVIVEGEDKGD